MGKVVECDLPGTQMTVLGLLTNDSPRGLSQGEGRRRVAVYLPFGYMIGGPVVYLDPAHVRQVDLTAEEAMKLCATAQVGAGVPEEPPSERPRKARPAQAPPEGGPKP